jgi:pimeloyl-ACP methyl ester carboxylesterase
MADDIIALIHELNLENPALLGYSDGGIIGLKIAMKEVTLLSHLILCSANLSPKGFDKKTIDEMIIAYLQEPSPYLKLMIEEPQIKPKQLEIIQSKTLVITGENDLVKLKHSELIHKHINHSSLLVMKGHDHFNYIVHQDLLKKIIIEFLE